MPRKIPVWKAPRAALDAMPSSDGNQYNGVGETASRPPKPFFWHPPDKHQWGEMQSYTAGIMYGQTDSEAVLDAFSVDKTPGKYKPRGPEPRDVAAEKTVRSPEDAVDDVKRYALEHGADDVGIARLDPNWVFDGYQLEHPWIISVAVQHDYENLKHAPPLPGENRALLEIGRQYTRAASAASYVRNHIRSLGYNATAYEGPRGDALLMIPAAIAAGLGELGKHHSMIHRRFGANFRLSAVATDMPLLPDVPDNFGAADFCESCQVCVDACPPAAIQHDKQMVRGEMKWYVDFEKCMPYFAEARSCGICLAVCPWSRPGVADNLVAKMARRTRKDA